MSSSTTLKTTFVKIGSFVVAIAFVVALLVLQAVSISSKKNVENDIVKIFEYQPQQKKVKPNNEVRKIKAMVSDVKIGRNLPVEIPTINSSSLSLPEASISVSKNDVGDFSLAIFSTDTANNFTSDIFELDMLDSMPRRLDKTVVSYPKQMLKRGIEGSVKLRILIDSTGVVSIESVISATNSYFEKVALNAVEKFLYEAPLRNGKPVKARFVLEVPFKIIR